MSTKHTPGPWVVDIENTGVELFDSQGMPVMTMARGVAELHANARLIAAAPELLDALKDCRRALELANATGELAVVDAAIAKATGEQP